MCRYYNDLWVFDLEGMEWAPIGQAHDHRPSPRGGCQLNIFEDVLYLYGGYSKRQDEDDSDMEHGIVHDDMWALDLKSYKVTGVFNIFVGSTFVCFIPHAPVHNVPIP